MTHVTLSGVSGRQPVSGTIRSVTPKVYAPGYHYEVATASGPGGYGTRRFEVTPEQHLQVLQGLGITPKPHPTLNYAPYNQPGAGNYEDLRGVAISHTGRSGFLHVGPTAPKPVSATREVKKLSSGSSVDDEPRDDKGRWTK